MSKQTKQEANIANWQALGYKVDPRNTSRKYVKMVRGDRTVWLGKAGAIRVGRTIADSVSITPA